MSKKKSVKKVDEKQVGKNSNAKKSAAKKKAGKNKASVAKPVLPVLPDWLTNRRAGIPPHGKRVGIFGAGISGLTAAHELIERGYQVEVFEKEEADPVQAGLRGEVCAIGGVARTQWGSVFSAGVPDKVPTSPVPRLPRVAIFFTFLTQPLPGRPDSNTPNKIAALADAIGKIGPEFTIEVRGHSRVRPGRGPADPRPKLRADLVASLLVRAGIPAARLKAVDGGLGRAGDWTAAAEDRDYVDFHVMQDVLPGEHGFRFFPSFYRNLFDTMKRIPIADDRVEFHETPSTVLDNIVSTEYQRAGLNEDPAKPERSFEFRRHPNLSLRDGFDLLAKILESLECTAGDIVQHQLRLFKYMTSCPERRAREYEYQSWYDFMDADRFSPKFRKIFDLAGQTNVAVRAAECDARTYGNVSVQLFLDQMRLAENVDGTLNGPTSVAWFDHWRRYLQEQGVIFRRGELVGWRFFQPPAPQGEPLPPVEPRPVVKIWRREIGSHDPNQVDVEVPHQTLLERDFYVVAVPLDAAVGLFKDDPNFSAPDFVRLSQFWTPLGADQDVFKILDKANPSDDDKKEFAKRYATHRWLQRPLAGIQFFLRTDGGFVRGHTSYLESEWRLSSISQPQFWLRRRGWWDGYRGVLSVDVGEWSDAWTRTKDYIIAEVWKQVNATIHDPTTVPDTYVAAHVDTFIEFDPLTQRPTKNKAPYLVTRTGEFPKRPGRLDRRNGYEVHFGRIVLAGTYMQTYTRLTTMESANESGRHAANGILRADDFHGSRCEIHNPEEEEMKDLKLLVELDQRLVAMGLPHLADILDLSEVPASLLCAGWNPQELLALLGLDPSGGKGV